MPWLMKAEPDSRIVKGKDVRFSVDHFEEIGISPWDGVRNHEVKKIMKEKMKTGDKVLFYHSNCKTPGVFALAEIAKEGYPDHTAWDQEHPYFDPKSSKESPTWFMVDVQFKDRLPHPPTLALVKQLASSSALPQEVSYIGKQGLDAIKAMALVNRGRLSVQPVEGEAYDAIVKLGMQGGWDSLLGTRGRTRTSTVGDKATSGSDEDKKNARKTASKVRERSEKNKNGETIRQRRSKRIRNS
ncbi:uncharacterized protein L203_105018 [Cryptococcus depauperatus CBS 7841]|uniref:EVE domain-containing protein n=1 Tax=Cryptococcus depauperatus CBS 7841 TaxID=1295531 RepID=A0A1E3I198_9TREE|nr:hypothetical protein L203_05484 [Cryptococcus depauperatus CBS 7841]